MNFSEKFAICFTYIRPELHRIDHRATLNVERQNRTLLDCVRCYIDKSPTSWDKHLGPLAGALRSSVNRQTGYTPNRLLLGREVHIPATLVYHPPPSASSQNGEDNDDMVDNDNTEPEVKDNPDPVDQYVATLHERLTTAHTLARKQLETAQKIMKRDYDLRLRQRQYKLGDVVYYVNNVCPKSGKKLFPPWAGPGVICDLKSDTVYEVKTRRQSRVMHYDKLKKCLDRKIPKWARDLSRKMKAMNQEATGDLSSNKKREGSRDVQSSLSDSPTNPSRSGNRNGMTDNTDDSRDDVLPTLTVRRRKNTSSVVPKKESTSSTKISDARRDQGAYLGTRGRAKATTQSTDRTYPVRTDVKRRVEPETRPPMRRDNQRRSVSDTRPPLRRDNRADAIDTRRRLEPETRRVPTRRRNAPRPIYCVCKTQNPRGYMVQCDACADWFHPRCVGITNEYAHR